MFALLEVSVVISAEVARRCVVAVVPNVVPVSVVMLAEAILRLLSVTLVTLRFVTVADV
jgi:hypothetical protein